MVWWAMLFCICKGTEQKRTELYSDLYTVHCLQHTYNKNRNIHVIRANRTTMLTNTQIEQFKSREEDYVLCQHVLKLIHKYTENTYQEETTCKSNMLKLFITLRDVFKTNLINYIVFFVMAS